MPRPKKVPAEADKAVIVPTDAQIAEYLAKQVPAPSAKFDWKLDAPVESRPIDLSKLPPPDQRRSVGISPPARVWGNNMALARGLI